MSPTFHFPSSVANGKRTEKTELELTKETKDEFAENPANVASYPGSILLRTPGTNHTTLLRFTVTDYSNHINVLAKDCSIDSLGRLEIRLTNMLSEGEVDDQPRIRIPPCYFSYLTQRIYRPIRFDPLKTVDLLLQSELILPSTHEYLQDFKLMTGRLNFELYGEEAEDYKGRLKALPHHSRLWNGNGFTPSSIDVCKLLLLFRRELHITNLIDNKWVIDERYTSLYVNARNTHAGHYPMHLQYFRNFCQGTGPSDWSGYAKRLLDEMIDRARRMNCQNKYGETIHPHTSVYLPSCWRYLYAGEGEGAEGEGGVEEEAKSLSIGKSRSKSLLIKSKHWVESNAEKLKRHRRESSLGEKENIKAARVENLVSMVETLSIEEGAEKITNVAKVDSKYEEEKEEDEKEQDEGEKVPRKQSLKSKGWKLAKKRLGSIKGRKSR